jgi:putative transposase
VIWCPKFRRAVLTGEIADYAKKVIRDNSTDYKVIELEVMADHIHLLVEVNPRLGIYKVVSKIKAILGRELREKFPSLKSRLPCMWSDSRFISTVGAVSLEVVKQYILDQKGK